MLRIIKWCAPLFAIALVIIAFGTASSAQSATVYSIDTNVSNLVTVNQCSAAGEPVSLSGTLHFEYSFTTDGAGINHFAISASSNLTGVGQTSGGNYSAADSSTYTVNSGDPSADLTVDMKSDLKPANGSSPLTLVQTLHITVNVNGNITGQLVQSTTQCGS